MDDADIVRRISELADQEHALERCGIRAMACRLKSSSGSG